MKSFQELLEESYEEEHAAAVRYAYRSFENWLNLIIWDLLEIQDAARSLREATTDIKKLKYLMSILQEDIVILNDQVSGSPKIFFVQESNLKMIKIAGEVQETLSALEGKDKLLLQSIVDELKDAIKLYNENSKNPIYSFLEATKRWNRLPLPKKEQFLYDFESRLSKVLNENLNDPNGIYLKA